MAVQGEAGSVGSAHEAGADRPTDEVAAAQPAGDARAVRRSHQDRKARPAQPRGPGGADDRVRSEHPARSDANVVRLVGRVSAAAEERTLPSGDRIASLRLIVRRGHAPGRGSMVLVDVIDVCCWTAATRRVAARLGSGDRAEVQGALRRRFFRSGVSVQSRYEVQASSLRRLASGSAS